MVWRAVTYALLAIAAALAGAWALTWIDLADERLTSASLRTELAQVRELGTRAALRQSERFRGIEAAMQTQKEEAERELTHARRIGADRLAAERALGDRLRHDIAAFAAGRASPAAEDSVATCRADAATLGDLLGEALRAEEDATAAAESHAGDVRALLRAWPVNPPEVTTR